MIQQNKIIKIDLKFHYFIEFIMIEKFTFETVIRDLNEICITLSNLVETPGPSRCVAKLIDGFDPRLGRDENYPMYQTIRKIVNNFNKTIGERIYLKQHNGNIIIIGGFDKSPNEDEIKEIPVTLASHADEITFMIKKKGNMDKPHCREVLPLCATKLLVDQGIVHKNMKIYGFRVINSTQTFCEIRKASIFIEFDEHNKPHFFIKLSPGLKEDILEGDVVIQDYNETQSKNYNIDTIFHCKALDDRVGMLCHLYTIYYLTKYTKIKSKAIFAGDEEGIPTDVSWARLVEPTFESFCIKEGTIIICDGIDGFKMKEFPIFQRIHEALIIPYTADGKGGGDHGLFSFLRDLVLTKINKHNINFHGTTCTDYASRSIDPKIMNKFPLICFINWSNGPVLPEDKYPVDILREISADIGFISKCHVDESISVRQILNIIGTTYYAYKELHNKYI